MAQYYYNPFENDNKADEPQIHFEQQQKIKAEKSQLKKISFGLGLAIIAYLVIQSVASIAMAKLNLYSLYSSSSVFQYAFNVIFVSFLSVAFPFGICALVFRKKYKHPVVPNKPIKFSRAILWICLGMGGCLASNIITNYVIAFFKSALGLELTQSTSLSPDSLFACVMEIIGIALIPAICEEFAMRCCSLQLLRNYGKGFAICAVSVVFGLLHGNVIQFVFAFLVGLILAFVTIKTDSIVPAICIHALNNGLSAFQDIVKYFSTDTIASNAVSAVFLLWGVLAVISLIVLAFKGEFKKSSEDKDGKSALTTGEKIGAFLPGMIIPFLILILITVTTINKI